tara:strand:- start:135 stop:1169 length:1035 start_codon:yes stop_codon:yes gene_type:complete
MVYIIAEIGVNFYDIAKKYNISLIDACKLMIVEAKINGANAVKFQAYKADKLVSKNSPAYWDTTLEPTKTQYDLFKKHDSFEKEDFIFLSKFCKEQNIDFICTPFDLDSVEYLNDMVDVYKISSSDITNKPLVLSVANKNKKILLSTGASSIEDISNAVNLITSTGNNDIVIMHCVLSYPTDDTNANLNMITSIKNKFSDFEIGYSDHTKPDNNMLIVSTAYTLGAKYIEKHYTLDKLLPGNDHYHSMDSTDLKKFRDNCSFLDIIIGNKEKEVLECEKISRKNARRSIYVSRDLKNGDTLSKDDLICKRPNTGIDAMDIDKIIGKKINKDLKEDDVLLGSYII